MPRLPDYTELGRRPSAPVTGPVNVPSPMQSPLGDFGSGLQQASDQLYKIQEEADNIAAEDAYNKFIEKRLEATHGDNGFSKVQGENAVKYEGGLFNSYNKRLEDARKEIEGSLQNDSQIEKFQKRAAIATLQYKQDMLTHLTRETDRYETSVYEGTMKTELSNIEASWVDDKAISMSMMRMEDSIKKQAARKGTSAEETKQLIAGMKDKSIQIAIDQALEAGDIATAKEKYKKYSKNLIDKTGTWGKIIAGEVDVTARAEVDRHMAMIETGQMTKQQALDNIRASHKGTPEQEKIAVEAVKRLKIRYNEANTLIQQDRDEADNEASHIYVREGFSAISDKLKRRMNGRTLIAMEKAAREPKKTTQMPMHNEFYRKLENGDIKSEDEVAFYQSFMTDSDAKSAMKAFRDIDDIKPTEIKQAYLMATGKKWSDVQDSKSDMDDFRAFDLYVRNAVETTKDRKELSRLSMKWNMPGSNERATWRDVLSRQYWSEALSDSPDTYGEAVRRGQLEGFRFKFDDYEVSDNELNTVMEVMRKRSIPITEENLETYFKNTKGKK